MSITDDNNWWAGFGVVLVIIAIITFGVLAIFRISGENTKRVVHEERTELEHQRMLRDRVRACETIEEEAVRALCVSKAWASR